MSKSKTRFLVTRSIVRILSKLQIDQADLSDIYFCYRLLLGRKADSGGWQHWSKQAASGMTAVQLTKSFLASREFHQKQKSQDYIPVKLDDFVIYIDPDDPPIAESISQHKVYEPHVTALLKREIKPDHVFLDIGCSIGWFTLLAASIVKDGKVIGLEPNHSNLQLLYRSLVENHFENVIIFPYAATDRRTLLQLSGHAAYGFVHSPENIQADYVQGVAIDELLGDELRIDIVKIDIEGHEPIALQGMLETISKHRPLIFSEFHPRCIRTVAGREPSRYIETLINMGYRLSVIEGNGDELDFGQASEVMDYWQMLNQKHSTGDMMHLDIVARPI
ncbi:MAG TPA: FkbM family methyltransferase [Pyrinomonadaceae bacterium]